jgi:hypothetical protein
MTSSESTEGSECKHEVATQRFHFYQENGNGMSWWCTKCGAFCLSGREIRLPADHAKANRVDALVKALKLIEGTPGFGHTYAARIARDALAALQGSKVDD